MAITWITGESGSGKTTLAKRLIGANTILLDADEMRSTISKGLGFTPKDRLENNLRIAGLANLLNKQGFEVVVSTICPTVEIKEKVYWVCKCRFIEMSGRYVC